MTTLQNIYDIAIKQGIENDLRGKAAVQRHLKHQQEKFNELSKVEQKGFDRESLTNPYADARIYVGDPKTPIKRVAMGIDIEVGEILLAHELSKTKKIDAIITHHPVGIGLAALHEVMHLQAEVMAMYGVPIHIAENLLHSRIEEISRKVSPVNHGRDVDAARLLNIPLLSVHTPTDNMVATFIKNQVDKNAKKLTYVKDVLKLFEDEPEYQEAKKLKAGPRLFAGRPDRYAGKIAVTEITGGTEGASEVYQHLSQAGIGTVIGMHMSEKHKEAAEKAHMNAIVLGHMSSDSLGMNIYADHLERLGVEVVALGGFTRFSRLKKRK